MWPAHRKCRKRMMMESAAFAGLLLFQCLRGAVAGSLIAGFHLDDERCGGERDNILEIIKICGRAVCCVVFGVRCATYGAFCCAPFLAGDGALAWRALAQSHCKRTFIIYDKKIFFCPPGFAPRALPPGLCNNPSVQLQWVGVQRGRGSEGQVRHILQRAQQLDPELSPQRHRTAVGPHPFS